LSGAANIAYNLIAKQQSNKKDKIGYYATVKCPVPCTSVFENGIEINWLLFYRYTMTINTNMFQFQARKTNKLEDQL